MKTKETKTGEELVFIPFAGAAAKIQPLAKELRKAAKVRAELMLSCVEILLSERHSLCDDFAEHLKEEKEILTDRVLDLYEDCKRDEEAEAEEVLTAVI